MTGVGKLFVVLIAQACLMGLGWYLRASFSVPAYVTFCLFIAPTIAMIAVYLWRSRHEFRLKTLGLTLLFVVNALLTASLLGALMQLMGFMPYQPFNPFAVVATAGFWFWSAWGLSKVVDNYVFVERQAAP